MRAALICLPQPGEAAMPAIAGKSLARRQLLFAQEAGCTAVIAFGGGASPDAIDFRHAVERAGMKYQVISTALALPGIIADDDSLLVLQPGLLPESPVALDLLKADGNRVLVVSAGPGVAAGLERIDLDRAWAGALTLPGRFLGKVANLPEDVAPAPALLRIALQQRLSEVRMSDAMLDDGRWSVIRTQDMAEARALLWQRTHLGDVPPGAPSRWLGRAMVAGKAVLEWRHLRAGLLVLTALLLGGGVLAGWFDMPALGFALVALAMPVIEGVLAIAQLGVAPFGKIRRWPWLRRVVDLALITLGVLSIDSLPHRVLFPPLVLGAALILLDLRSLPAWLEPLRDRMVIAGLVAVLALVIGPEMAIMLAATLVLAANLWPQRG
ncbi:MAG: hypothetical protein KDE15_02515 [Erythrobacter sp.]|nr:hypothetical protein [Erythrobacter sp.]